MDRNALIKLKKWLINDNARQPLILRGARQVGKTWIVSKLANQCHYSLIELNFEEHFDAALLFESNDPRKILSLVGSYLGLPIGNKPLLFLNEIQAAPKVLAKLRWFAE